jgi:hypothetical protein
METVSTDHQVSGVSTKMVMEFPVRTMPSDRIEELWPRAGESQTVDALANAASGSSYQQSGGRRSDRGWTPPVFTTRLRACPTG